MKQVRKIKIRLNENSKNVQIKFSKSKIIIKVEAKKKKILLENWYKKLNEFVELEKF